MEPLKFKPILKTLVWGTENWVLSGVEGNESVVAEGPQKGRTLNEIYGREFPLLIKFIDAHKDLSIQVHPNDELAAKRHGCKGKTEMWYIIGTRPGAYLYSGLSQKLTPEQYGKMVEEGTITEALSRYDVKPGDVFYLPAGRIHAIGGGCYLAEVQQTSNITYRIFDYNRPGLDGKPRELHTELAKDAIDYTVYPDYRTAYEKKTNDETVLVDCPHFTTSLYELTCPLRKDISTLCSFLVVICMGGAGTVRTDEGEIAIAEGETVLVSESSQIVEFIPSAGTGMNLMTSYVK